MSLHRLLSMRVGVPRPDELAAFYSEVGLTTDGAGHVSSPDGGTQVVIEEAPFRQLLGVEVGVGHERDLDEIHDRLDRLGIIADGGSGPGALRAVDPTSQVRFGVTVAERLVQSAAPLVIDNRPGAIVRRNERATAVFQGARPPRRLGHLVIGTPDITATQHFLVEGLGFKVSDQADGIISFLRCSTDHHNIGLVHSPVPILQHYSWECDDVDHVGHTATALLRADEGRPVWGLGRHFAGSNFYWYLRDPAGSFIELFSDLDMIDDDDAWEAQRTPLAFEHVANIWGPNIPMEFIAPQDLPELKAAWAAR
jgi:catechol 2,3-dioxygenase-like lactoylglutathione lyase family enzyme